MREIFITFFLVQGNGVEFDFKMVKYFLKFLALIYIPHKQGG